MQRRLTIRDIARIADVSPSTVSRSLNDSPLVADETKARIREIAEQGNFSFNATARSLVMQRTGIVGLICPDSFDEYQYSLHLTLLINQIRRTLETEDLDLIVKFRHDANGVNTVHHLLDSRKVDGLIIINPDITEEELAYIHEHQLPTVFVQAIPPEVDLRGENYVFADHVAGGTIATNHLIDLGHEEILCFTVDTPERSFHERTEGYRQALRDHGLPVRDDLIHIGDGTFEFGYQFVLRNRERFRDGISAIFSQTDIMALGAIEGLWDSGLEVPRNVAIVSYDDIGFGKDFRPRLTTVHQPRDRLAVSACRRLGEMLNAVGTEAPTAAGAEARSDAAIRSRREARAGAAMRPDVATRPGAESMAGAESRAGGGSRPGAESPTRADGSLLQRRVQPYLVVRESCGAERREGVVREKSV